MSNILELVDGEPLGTHRSKLNSNFESLNDGKAEVNNVLSLNQTTPYSPSDVYHPVTLQWVTNKFVDQNQMYDPQGIQSDAFNRANHTGDIPAINVTQSTDYRMVTDVQISGWGGAEPEFAKNSAFNKDFGVIANTVSEGNHNHNALYAVKAVGSVEGNFAIVNANGNFSDSGIAPTPGGLTGQFLIKSSDNDYEYIWSDFTPQEFIDFVPRFVTPAHKEGRIFYDTNKHCLSVYSIEASTTLNIGQENWIRVFNNTGVTILNGKVCRATGVVNGNIPEVELAIADSFANSLIAGIATHDIENGTSGFITILGQLDANFSAFNPGDVVYLSDLYPGEMTIVPPDIASAVGYILSNGALGSMHVRVRNQINLPPTLGFMNNLNTPIIDVTSTPQNIVDYVSDDNLVMYTDALLGQINVRFPGYYRFNLGWGGTTDTDRETLFWELYNFSTNTILYTLYDVLGRSLTDGQVSGTFNMPINIPLSNQSIGFRLRSSTSLQIDAQYLNFDVTSIHIR